MSIPNEKNLYTSIRIEIKPENIEELMDRISSEFKDVDGFYSTGILDSETPRIYGEPIQPKRVIYTVAADGSKSFYQLGSIIWEENPPGKEACYVILPSKESYIPTKTKDAKTKFEKIINEFTEGKLN
jgi:hypothetical protein